MASAEPFLDTRAVLEERKAAGLHAGMQFTFRNPARSTDPAATVRGARALVVGARRYAGRVADGPDTGPGGRPQARVARFAARDHYAPLRAGLEAVAAELRTAGWRALVQADENGMVDRAAAHRAGLGWYGKNANLLLPGQGSWFLLGSVITDAPLTPTAPASAVPDGCGSCTRCLHGCPTGAIVAPGVIDARRCLAWLVQQPGVFPVEHREALGDRIYGCDDCQEVCPPNRHLPDDGDGDDAGATVDVLDLLAAPDDELLARYGRWYIADRDPDQLRRNALVVLGNTGDPASPAVRATVAGYRDHPVPWVRDVASWASSRLDARSG